MKVYFYSIFKISEFNFVYIIFFLLSFFFVNCSLSSAEVVDRIIAIVNDKIITLSELNLALKPYLARIKSMGRTSEDERQFLYTVRKKILNDLINDKLTYLEAKHYNVTVTDDEIDQTIERIKETNYHTDEDFREILAKEGLTIEEYRRDLKEQMLRSRVVDYEVRSKVVITKEDIMAYYEANQEKYADEKRYHLRNILMRPSSFEGEETRQKLLDKMQDILAKLKEGESFSDLARVYSQSPFAAEGGDLGFFKFDDLAPTIQDALKGLMAGEGTGILDTDQGFQMFYIEDIEDTLDRSLEEVSKEIKEILYNERVNKRFKVWIEGMRAKSHIKIIQ
ncbi:MAG: SurA N-terminal domain-containing protein [Desulfosarcina sp.]|nr:SurA N-terminal domain-containing protein [Desulfobacterales bacterium]